MKNACPHLVEEWHPTKNIDYDVNEVTKGQGYKTWWRCREHGHEWKASINQRVRGTGCPYCSGKKILQGFNDLATTHPHLAKQWHPTKNGDLTPRDVSRGKGMRVWWQCEEGHVWSASIKQRATAEPTDCPICYGRRSLVISQGFNDLETTHPHLAKQWHPTKNEGLTPQQVSFGMGRKVWWQCECGCEWPARILSRHQGRGCPDCGMRRRRGPRKKDE